jgi:dipeptidase D
MNNLSNLNPKEVFSYFEEISKIPRASGKEEAIIKYLKNFAEANKLSFKVDKAGNVLIKKEASNKNITPVILQTHLDMVCEKNADSKHNFDTDPIIPVIKDEWITANGTTLGADDGIGIAMQLAILTSKDIEHGTVYCLFTTDEETGLNGAKNISPDFFEADILINLDSEQEGEIFIGCAGGMDTLISLHYKSIKTKNDKKALKIFLKGLKGGHSGDDIHRGRGNSIVILNRLLWNLNKKFNIDINIFEGGNLRNAIPREAYAVIVFDPNNEQKIIDYFNEFINIIKNEISDVEPDVEILNEIVSLPDNIIDEKTKNNLLNALYACPHGVIGWSRKMPDLVETSTNLASIKFEPDKNKINIATSQRSSVSSLKYDICAKVKSVFELIDAEITTSVGYPGWNPNPDSKLVKLAEQTYYKLFNSKPHIRAIHAGLECGLFLEKKPSLDMISIGPTLKGVHSPNESLHIASVEKCYNFLLELLKNLR